MIYIYPFHRFLSELLTLIKEKNMTTTSCYMETHAHTYLKRQEKNGRIYTRLTLAKQEEEMKQVPKELIPL